MRINYSVHTEVDTLCAGMPVTRAHLMARTGTLATRVAAVGRADQQDSKPVLRPAATVTRTVTLGRPVRPTAAVICCRVVIAAAGDVRLSSCWG